MGIAKLKMKIWTALGWTVVIFTVVLIAYLAYCAFSHSWKQDAFYKDHGAFADYFNAILGPFIGIVGVTLTFFAFFVQYRANRALSRQQRVDRFEQRFFEMLKIHRENAAGFEIEFGESPNKIVYSGKKALRIAVGEIDYVYESLKEFRKASQALSVLNDQALFEFAFRLVYWGYEPAAPLEASQYEMDAELFSIISTELPKILEIQLPNTVADAPTSSPPRDAINYRRVADKCGLPNGFDSMAGHYSHLSHYFRHLQRIVELVDDFDEDYLSQREKRQFVKIPRSQLSNDEEKLLYYYSIVSAFGKRFFWDSGWMVTYELIRNVVIKDFPEELSPVNAMRRYLKKVNRKEPTDKELHALFDDLQYQDSETDPNDLP